MSKSTENTSNIRPCTLIGLKIMDKVKINHAHTFIFGYWEDWTSTDYWYIGIKKGTHCFVNCAYRNDYFYMDKENEGSSVLKGVYVM
jgi:hypothetical protein